MPGDYVGCFANVGVRVVEFEWIQTNLIPGKPQFDVVLMPVTFIDITASCTLELVSPEVYEGLRPIDALGFFGQERQETDAVQTRAGEAAKNMVICPGDPFQRWKDI